MSFNYRSLTGPSGYAFSEEAIERLGERFNKPESRQNALSEIAHAGALAAYGQAYGIKPQVPVGEGLYWKNAKNCTDETLATLELCAKLGIRAYAGFNGSHANVVVPKDNESYWQLDYSDAYLVRSEEPNDVAHYTPPTENTDEHSGILLACAVNISTGLSGILPSNLYGYDLRSQTIQSLEAIERSTFLSSHVLLEQGIAEHTLRALDIVDTMKSYKRSQRPYGATFESFEEAFIEAKRQLKPFIPVLKPLPA